MADISFRVNTTGSWSLPDDRALVHGIAEKTRAEWIKLAQVEIPSRSLSGEYIRAIQPVESDVINNGAISKVKLLDSDNGLVRKLEFGSNPYDMKEGLLSGPKARTGKKGKYNIIPITHGSPRSSKNPVPTKIFDSLRAGGGRLPLTGPQGNRRRSKTTELLSVAPRYQGLTERPVAGRGSVLETYRTVSENSDSKSWWHPGFNTLNLAEKASAIIARELTGIIERT